MCLAERAKCKDECPFGICENGEGLGCDVFVQKFPMTAIEVVQKWSDEHPVKTRLEDLLEKYPKFKVSSETGRPTIKPRMFGYCDNCTFCPNNKAGHCWDEPADGGATGKAVE